MNRLLIAVAAVSLVADPVLAQSGETEQPAEKPQMCEMMHDGSKMQGMMVKGKDGKMHCTMMDHAKMNHEATQPDKDVQAPPPPEDKNKRRHDHKQSPGS